MRVRVRVGACQWLVGACLRHKAVLPSACSSDSDCRRRTALRDGALVRNQWSDSELPFTSFAISDFVT
eukprot:3542979-Pleurochrysis_carterae.AAC.1